MRFRVIDVDPGDGIAAHTPLLIAQGCGKGEKRLMDDDQSRLLLAHLGRSWEGYRKVRKGVKKRALDVLCRGHPGEGPKVDPETP